MTKPMGRRAFLKGVAAAPAVAQKMAEDAVGAEVASSLGASVGFAPPPIPGGSLYGASSQQLLALATLQKQGLLPDWLKRHFARVSMGHSRWLDPDVACLQSLSLGSKLRISAERRAAAVENGLGEMAQQQIDQEAMNTFFGWKTR